MGCKLKEYIFLVVIGLSYFLTPAMVKAAPANPSFTDDNFYNCVVDSYNKENNTNVSYTENLSNELLKTIKKLVCSGYQKSDEEKITNVSGIEKLSSLQEISLGWNNIETMDLSNNSKIKSIYLEDNNLNSINVSKNFELDYLNLEENNINDINLNNNTKLTRLYLSQNNLVDIDVSKNTKLQHLFLSRNDIEHVDLSNNTELTYLQLYHNKIAEIDLSKNIELVTLDLSDNQLTEIDLTNNTLLKNLDLGNDLEGCENNQLKEIDLSKNILLTNLDIKDNQLEKIDLSKNTQLVKVNLYKNQLKSINLGSNTVLTELNVSYNNLTNLDVSKNISLTTLYPVSNPLKYLDLSNNINLKKRNYYQEEVHITTGEEIILYFGDKIVFNEFDDKYFIPPSTYDLEVFSEAQAILKYKNYAQTGLRSGDVIMQSGLYNFYIIFTHHSLRYDLYVLKATSDKYKVNASEGYVYTKNDIATEKILNNISLNYGEKIIENNKLLIKYKGKLVKEFEIKNIDFGDLTSGNGFVIISNDINYDDFIKNITVSEGLTYKIFNGSKEIANGNILPGMTLKVYYNNELIDTYKITDEYLDLSLLNVIQDKGIIKNLLLGTNVGTFKEKISTSGTITIVDKDNAILIDDKLIATGSKVKIELPSQTYEYTIAVKGDVTGTGKISIADIAKSYQYLKKKIDMEECYKEAGNVVGTDEEIKINDVAKLYQYVKKKINSLD